MSTSKNVYSIDRNLAAESLKVSLRTLNRYITTGVLRAKREGRRILLCEDEILKLQKKKQQFLENAKIDRFLIRSGRQGDLPVRNDKAVPSTEKIFQKLYCDLLLDMKEQQKRLEGANYRVGQLEAQLKNTVPLLEHHAASLKLKEKEAELLKEKEKLAQELRQAKTDKEKTLFAAQFELRKLKNTLFTEKINKWAYIIVLFLVLLAQPVLWFLLNK